MNSTMTWSLYHIQNIVKAFGMLYKIRNYDIVQNVNNCISQKEIISGNLYINIRISESLNNEEKTQKVHHSPCQTFEKLAHSHEIKLIGAVEHHTLNGHGFSQILQHIHTKISACWFLYVLSNSFPMRTSQYKQIQMLQ